MGIRDALDMQEKLLSGWRSPKGLMALALYGDETGDDPMNAFVKLEGELISASPVYITSEICDLIEFGERSFPELFTLKEEDVPVRRGFAMFEKALWLPHVGKDFADGNISLKYVGWALARFKNERTGEIQSGLWYTFYNDNPLGSPAFGVYHSSGWFMGEHQDWSLDNPRRTKMGISPEMTRACILSTRYLMSFFRFISTKVIEERREPVLNKSVRRRFKSGPLGRVPDIHVVRLREVERPKCEESSPRQVNWSRRWPVDAHWHNYYYRTTGEHRPLWVDSYVKGPSDKPLIVPDKKSRKGYKVDR